MKPSVVTSYLTRRALLSPWCIEGAGRADFAATVVIPALAEGESLWTTLRSLAANPPALLTQTLVLVVVNQRVDAPESDRSANRADLQRLRQGAALLDPLQLAWVDAASDHLELPAKGGGVGMARKIGFDLALSRLDLSLSAPFLVGLDADTLVRPDYLPALFRHFEKTAAGGAVLPFAHQAGDTPAEQAAIERYELYLRHYVLGLELAGSPYAFLSVGSALACRAEAYAKAGGMNRRTAGEDFYFLQQLAKVSGVERVRGTVVYPSARPSGRTPFGTGRSIARLLAGESAAVTFYHHRCFDILKRWLALIPGSLGLDGTQLLREAGTISAELAGYLEQQDFPRKWDALRENHPRPIALLNAFHGWFDGLRTLRLIHHLSHGDFERGSAEMALPQLFSWAGAPASGTLTEQLVHLRRMQQDEL